MPGTTRVSHLGSNRKQSCKVIRNGSILKREMAGEKKLAFAL